MGKHNKYFLSEFIQNTSLRTKLIIIFSVLLLIPLGIFTYFAVFRITNILRDQTLSAAYKTFYETATVINTKTQKATNVVELLTYDELIYKMASTDPQDYPYIRQFEDSRALSSTFEDLEMLSEVNRIRLYVNNDYLYSNENEHIFPISQISSLVKFQSLNQAQTHQWFTPHDFCSDGTEKTATFSCMRMIYNPSSLTTPLAVLRIDLDQSTIVDALHCSSTTQHGMVFLLDGSEVILTYNVPDEFTITPENLDVIQNSPSDNWQTLSIVSDDYYFFRLNLQNTNWQLVTIIPYNDIYSLGNKLRNEMVLVVVCLVGLALFCAVILSNLILRRIWALSSIMQHVEAGDIDIQPMKTSKDEVGQLILHFNRMMDHLKQLMDEKVKYGIEIKNLELKALQAQINPHFLYNTLDTINCLAFETDSPQIRELVNALATFYKISLSKGAEQISIRNEILHAQTYVCIQNYRFADQIHVSWDIAPEILDKKIIKIVLQPIIENAMIHGIFEREDSCGNINIKGWIENNDIYISIEDNGVGMSKQIIDANFRTTNEEINTPGGYGIRNINDRIKIAYGSQYGLSCTSIVSHGTTILIHIPCSS